MYLHSDDRTDIAAMATISTISQPLRVAVSLYLSAPEQLNRD
ncbi:hypothetical protein ACG0XD_27565, partial [Klebsiella pneumoniae]